MRRLLLVTLVLTCTAALAQSPQLPPPPAFEGKWGKRALAQKPLWATLKTTKGDIVVRLFSREAPATVANFVSLAAAEVEWTHPFTQAKTRWPLYDGSLFHRVIDGFMVQGGDPTATGRGGPGWAFGDEPSAPRKFDRPGLLAMANRGPDTNGSQFFITLAKAPHLDERHTIFGEVVAGMGIVKAIGRVPVDPDGRPQGEDVVLKNVVLSPRAPRGVAASGRAK